MRSLVGRMVGIFIHLKYVQKYLITFPYLITFQ